MKFTVSSYSFCPDLDSGKRTLYDVIRLAAKIGYDAVEIANVTGSGYDYTWEGIRQTAEEAGIEVSSVMTSANFAHDVDENVRFLKEEIDRTAFIGAKLMRTDIYREAVADPYDPVVIAALRHLAAYAGEKGVVLTTENHGGFFSLPDRLEQLVLKVNHPNFGLLFDSGNYMDAEVDPLPAMARLVPFVKHVHLKDAHILDGSKLYPGDGWYVTAGGNYWRCAIPGSGNAPLFAIAKTLYAAEYDGYLAVEFEGIEDAEMATTLGLKYLKRMLKAIPDGMWREE